MPWRGEGRLLLGTLLANMLELLDESLALVKRLVGELLVLSHLAGELLRGSLCLCTAKYMWTGRRRLKGKERSVRVIPASSLGGAGHSASGLR